MRRGLTTSCGSLSRETRGGAGRRPRFALSRENPLPGEEIAANRNRIRERVLPAWAAETGRRAGVKGGPGPPFLSSYHSLSVPSGE